MEKLVPTLLTAAGYAPFGHVIEAGERGGRVANQGRARVFDRLVPFATPLDPRSGASLNLSVFRTQPWPDAEVPVRILEKHPFSPQVFVPMNATRYLVIVALGRKASGMRGAPDGEPDEPDAPDLDTLAAFVAGARQGVSYLPGVWHHPMIALDRETDFLCLVSEDGTDGDCLALNVDGPTITLGELAERSAPAP
jgi:ureidoglycolate lyase